MLSRRSVLALLLAPAALPAAAQTSPKLPVVASFSIVGDITREVGGERIALTTLVGPGVDAHVYTPTPADARAVAEARLIVTNGLKFEGWMRRLRQSAGARAPLVEAARGVKAIEEKQGGHHHHHHGHGHAHDHGGLDPHAWQSIPNIRIYVANIRDALVAADPEGRAAYEANAARYLRELDELDAEIRGTIARIPVERRKVISSHGAFGYFEREYGLKFLAPRGVSTAAEPSARQVARLIEQIRKEKIPAVFVETIANPALMERIAKESGVRIGGTLFSDALSGPDGPAPTYIRMMRHNIRTIAAALAPQS